MNQKLQRYIKIDNSTLTEMKILPPSALAEFSGGGQAILSSRIFIETEETGNPGDVVEINLEIPEKGSFRGNGVVEWLNDGSISDKPAGMALHLFYLGSTASASEEDAAETAAPSPPEKEIDYSRSYLPDCDSLGEALGKLLDMKVTVKAGEPVELNPEIPSAIVTYKKENGSLKVIWLSDHSLVLYTGGGLSMVPLNTVESSLSSGEIPDNLKDNFQEALNVSTDLFKKSGMPDLTLGDSIFTPATVPAEIGDILAEPRYRVDYTVTIPEYGSGKVSLIEAK